jgi:SfnB family sulfur acquisition oxidoreductase
MTVQPAKAVAAFPVPKPRDKHAHVIRSDGEAIEIARDVAAILAEGAAERDRDRKLPYAEMDLLSDRGLLAITVPKEFGGAGVTTGTLAEVIALISAADGSIGQIPQNHFFMLEGLRLQGSPEQKQFFYKAVLAGERLGNALSEVGTRTAQDHATRITRDGDSFRLNGRKFYSTGALFAHWIAVIANNDDGKSTLAIVPRETEGLTIVDDWSGFGQRTTGSGTTILDNVAVHPFSVIPFHFLFETPSPMGPHAQIIHAAVDQGIARGAFAEAVRFVRQYTRPWKESGLENGYEDPHIISDIGEVKIRLDAADALLGRAARFVDEATVNPTIETVAAASIAVASAKVAATEVSLLAGSKLIELGGSRSTLAEFNLDRYWRNARTHTVHDPVRWKYRVIGNYWLNGINPPRHGAI